MDLISQLPDELLLRILSLLPTTHEVVATMVFSKRWQLLWTMVPKLVYVDGCTNMKHAKFSHFVDRSLLLHEAPVIETLQFELGKNCRTDDIGVWMRAADKLNVRELIFEFDDLSYQYRFKLPRSFYTGCRMLVKLTLVFVILVDVASPISFPSLKNLTLTSVKYPSTEFLNGFLSNCPVLEDLDLDQIPDDNVSICTLRVPSLKSLTLYKFERDDANGFVIDAPSLEKMKISDYTDGFRVFENDMPMIITVDFNINRGNIGNILGSVTSVKRLCLCLSTAEDAYPVGSVFHQLVSLNLCRCNGQWKWLNLLMRLLERSPKLRDLKLVQCHGFQADEPSPSWTKPSSVPDCLLSSLETLECKFYGGTDEEKDVMEYILGNGACLKKVIISFKPSDSKVELEMLKVLTLSSRRSPNCQLVFK